MVHITNQTVRYLASLAKIGCRPNDEERFVRELQGILQYVEKLEEVDTSSVEPLLYVIEGEKSAPLREDSVETSITTQEFLDQAPLHVAQMVKVPKFRKE